MIRTFIHNLLFNNTDSFNIAITRIVYCGALLLCYLYSSLFDNAGWDIMIANGHYNKSVNYHLITIFGIQTYTYLKYAFLITLASSMIGFYTRASLITTQLYSFYMSTQYHLSLSLT